MNQAVSLKRSSEFDQLAHRLLEIDSQLSSDIPTTLWISDLHGEGDRFKSILRGRFGLLYQSCKEGLPKTFPEAKLQYLVRVIRHQQFIVDPLIKMDRQDVLLCMVDIARYKLSNIERNLNKYLPEEYRLYVRRLLAGRAVPDPIFEVTEIADRYIAHLAEVIKQVILDRIIVLGDIWDRGSQPDKIIRILSSKDYLPMVRMLYGNHDILWMGAAAGNQSLVAEALRITCRYDHFEMLKRLGFDMDKLAEFAQRMYPPKLCTARFKAKTDRGLSMEKALSVIQFKLEDQLISRNPAWGMDSRRSIRVLAQKLNGGDETDLNDVYFPTIDLENPAKLTAEEQDIVDDLTAQFVGNRKLKRLMSFFFEHGHTYYIHNNLLNIHALVPSTNEGEFESCLGYKGRALLDHLDEAIKRAGRDYLDDKPVGTKDQDLFFYLWCGPKSPFFGKEAMKTFERYYLLDKETHDEPSLYWKQNLEQDKFKKMLLAEFQSERVIFGHTPVDVTKGKTMASKDGVAINVDGGFAAAYYNRGHALVHTPHMIYGIILPTPEEIEKASLTSETVPLRVEVIAEFDRPMRIKDTSKAEALGIERKQLMKKISGLSGK